MSGRNFLRTYRYWLPPVLLALALTFIFLNPFIGDWDALDYTVLSLRGQPSSMALGRSLFILFNYGLYSITHLLFGVRPEQTYVIFKYAVVVQSSFAVVACWILARDLSGSFRAATVASLLVAVSPMFVVYSGQVMTDVPSVLFTAAALVIHLRGVKRQRVLLVFAGAALLGLGVNLRETVGLYLPWLVIIPFFGGWKFERRAIVVIVVSVAIFLAFALGPFVFWFASDPHYRSDWHGWRASMIAESTRHPVELGNLRPFLIYFFLAAPLVFVALPVAAWKEWRERGCSLLLTSAAIGLFANVMLIFNYSTTINWRYFLTGLPVLAPLAGDYFVRSRTESLRSARLGFATTIVAVLVVAGLMGFFVQPKSAEYFARLDMAKNYDARLRLLPRNAVLIAGAETIAVSYWRGIGAGEWETIGVGAGWPNGRLETTVAEYLGSGRRVFLDADPRWWQPCSWHVSEITELVKLQTQFRFRHLAQTIYEVRPLEEPTATDQPHLESLLPQNRPDEVRKCLNVG